ncbi:MAG: redox-regulated ATPase YchF [Terriglobia bacterium]
MKAGIVGFPLVGKTTLFKILTKSLVDTSKFSGGKTDSHIGIASVPDPRLEFLSSLFNPKKTTHATVEYIDLAGLTKGDAKNVSQLGNVKNVEALVHVVRVFEDESIPYSGGTLDPKRDISNLDLELILSDLSIIERRLERLEKDLKKNKTAETEKEFELLKACNAWLESEKPLRAMDLSEDQRKLMRGFMFLSEKPILHVLNLADDQAQDVPRAMEVYQLSEIAKLSNVGITAVCGKLEAELVELSGEDAQAFLMDYGLKESGLDRLIRATYELLGLISFFTVGEDECRAWTIRRGTSALKAAGVIHTDIERCFIRAEVVHYDHLHELKSLAAARDKGQLRLEGKEYVVQDGDIINFRHSG